MYNDVTKYVSSCLTFQRNKEERAKEKGILQPHKIPGQCWEVWTMNFLTEIPTSTKGNDCVFVIVDNLSMCGLFIPTNKTNKSGDVVQILFDHVFPNTE